MKKTFPLLLAFFFCVIIHAKNGNPVTTFENIRTEIFNSKYVGEEYKIVVGLPFGYKEDKEYQVLYVLDANVTFGMVNDIVRLLSFERKTEPVIVVGVSYKNFNQWIRKRGRDFMPNYSNISEDKYVSKFHNFISLELIPHINGKFKTKKTKNIIYGHSSAAVYGMYSLFKNPKLFKNYILTSPSINEDKGFILGLEKEYHNKFKKLNVNLYTSIGSDEKKDFDVAYSQFKDSLNERKYLGLQLKNDRVPGTHMSCMAQAFINGFYFINGN